ncbi:MAG: phenylacetate--CoA ligase family protein, partial [Pseudomonadota bacterium]
MSTNFDLLELRSEDARTEEQFAELRKTLRFAVGHAPGLAQQLDGIDIEAVKDRADLAALPVLRKADLAAAQTPDDPLAGFATRRPYHFRHLFMSPGPIFEPGSDSRDFYRLARFVHASGVGMGDIVLNCFSYHLTPAGMMFENAVASVSATVVPAGVGQTELQVTAARQLGVTAYAGTPDYLKVILDKADETGTPLKIARALVSGGALFPSLRTAYAERGVITRQCYATADLGNIAYESEALEGLIVDEGAILEIVRPGT